MWTAYNRRKLWDRNPSIFISYDGVQLLKLCIRAWTGIIRRYGLMILIATKNTGKHCWASKIPNDIFASRHLGNSLNKFTTSPIHSSIKRQKYILEEIFGIDVMYWYAQTIFSRDSFHKWPSACWFVWFVYRHLCGRRMVRMVQVVRMYYHVWWRIHLF